MLAKIVLGVLGLLDGIVTLPLLFLWSVAEIGRIVVVVSALEGSPVLEALAAFGRGEVVTALTVDVPFSDPAGLVAGLVEAVRNAAVFGRERKVVEVESVREGIFAGD